MQGMLFIHDSSMLVCHGNLKSSNCVVNSRWVLQVSDFGLHDMRHSAESGSIGEHQYYRSRRTFLYFHVKSRIACKASRQITIDYLFQTCFLISFF